MHEPHNRQGHVWLLAGTGEGPVIAAALQQLGWTVSVSVVTDAAAAAYRHLTLDHLWVGALDGPEAIRARLEHEAIDRVVDATHPFATLVSLQLRQACAEVRCALVRFERPLEPIDSDSAVAIQQIDHPSALRAERLLLALGARHLSAVVAALQSPVPDLFARVLPTPGALRQALTAGIPSGHLALLRPLQRPGPVAVDGGLEQGLCRRWQITDVLCRQSGGASERCWHQVAKALDLRLWMLRRPPPPEGVEVMHSLEALLAHLA